MTENNLQRVRVFVRAHADVLFAAAVFVLSIGIVHFVPQSPFVAYAGEKWLDPYPSGVIATWYAAALAFSLAVAALAPHRPPRPFSTTHRAIVFAFLLYAATCGLPAYGGTDAQILARLEYLQAARWIALACGLGAFLRPALALPLILYVLWFRLESDSLYGLGSDNIDIGAIVYYGLLLTVSWMLLAIAARALPGVRRQMESGDAYGPRALLYVLVLCTASYAANYVNSGLGKLALPGPPGTWLLENHTDALIPVSHAIGTLPIAGLGWLAVLIYRLNVHFVQVINAMTLLVEMAPLIAIARPRWLAIAFAAIVPFHLGIFLLSGIFFWKWALVDAVLALVFWRLRTVRLPLVVALLSIAIVLLSPRWLPTARLAWYDSTTLNNSYFVAETEDGTKARVPSNYFLSASLPMAQMRFSSGFPTGVFGSTTSYADLRKANACEMKLVTRPAPMAAKTWTGLERFIREHHAWIVSRADADGRYAYDLYPHHVWSNPVLYEDFSAMDKRKIARYVFVTDYVCVGYDDNGLVRRVLGSDSRPISVR